MSRLRSTSSRKASQLVHDEEVFACERADDVGNDGGPQSYHVTIGWAIKHGAAITGTPVSCPGRLETQEERESAAGLSEARGS